jgi:hypothetical protein
VSDDISIPVYRVPRHHRGMDPTTRTLAKYAGIIGGIFLVGLTGWTLLGHRQHAVPVVQAESGPVRVKPANPGGLQIPGLHNDFFSGGSDTNVEKLAPAAETPDPQALQAPPPAPKPTPVAAATPAATASPALPPPAAPIASPAPRPPVAVAPAKPAPIVAAAPAPTAAHPAAIGRVQVQLAALTTEPAAHTEWARLTKRLPELLGSHQPAISKIEHDGHTFWRLRTGGFSDVSQATSFCERMRSKGASCSVAEF